MGDKRSRHGRKIAGAVQLRRLDRGHGLKAQLREAHRRKLDGGKVLVDGENIENINLDAYRSSIGYVPQEVFLFSDTIARNIAFGLDQLDMPKVEEAAKNAAVYKNIMAFDKKFETYVGERGITLSGGQKQRLFIARELYKNPEILILDEATSALDSNSEKAIQKSIEGLQGKLTVIIIAHRLSTIKNVDEIYVLEKGKLVEKGTYSYLMNKDKNSKFASMVELQNL